MFHLPDPFTMALLVNVRVNAILLLCLAGSCCLPIIHAFTLFSTNRIGGWDVRGRNDYKNSLIPLTSIANESLTILTKEIPTPFQEEIVEESKAVRRKSGIKVSSRARGKKPTNIHTVTSSQDYRNTVENFKENIIVTRFYAKWCKSCLATAPLFHRLARRNPGIIFIEVPVQAENSDLHQGLNVPSVPFSRIYYPSAGLVEEMKISKKRWHIYEKVVATYVQTFCTVEDGNYSNHLMCDDDLPY